MRSCHLYADRQDNILVQGLNAANALGEWKVAQGDKLQFIVHDVVKQAQGLTTYVERPLEFSEMRASIGVIDAAPSRGSFKLKVGAEITAEIEWPASLATSAEITTWKESVIAALEALPGIAAGAIELNEPADTPGNIFYLTWTDVDRDDEIEVVENRLLPPTEATVRGSLTAIGYTQLLKFAQFPCAMTDDFSRPMPPAVDVVTTVTGSAAANCEQTIVIPAGAVGSFSLQWGGASTKTLPVATVQAANIAAALNAIVTDGATNPSFRVEVRTAREGKRFAVEFIGPLAAADQAEFGVTMHDQESVPWAVGAIDLAEFDFAIEQALNGAGEVKLKFELVIVQAGEETFIREIIVVNDMTSGETASNAASSGAVQTVTNTVYVDAGLGEAFAEVAPGAAFVPPEAGDNFEWTHNLNTLTPKVWGLHRVSDDPEQWEQVQDNVMTVRSLTEDVVRISLPFALSDDELTEDDQPNPLWVERWKFFASSPDTQLMLFEHQHTWEQCRESLPAGQTVAAKFAALEAALGMLGGSLAVPAGNITGTIATARLDLVSLITALRDRAEFVTALKTIITAQESLVTTIAERLALVSAFVETLKTVFASSDTLRTSVVSSLVTHETFRAAVIAALQLGPGANTSFIPIVIPDLDDKLPALAAGALPGAWLDADDQGTISGYLPRAAEANAGDFYTVDGVAYARPRRAKVFADGAIVYSTGHDWFEATVSEVFEVVSALCSVTDSVIQFDHLIDKPAVVVGSTIRINGTRYTVTTVSELGPTDPELYNSYYEIEVSESIAGAAGNVVSLLTSTTFYPKELEAELFTLAVSEQMLSVDTQFTVAFAVTLQLLGNCEGYYKLELLLGTKAEEGEVEDNIEGIEWEAEPLVSVPIVVTDAAVTHGVVYKVTRDDDGLSAEKTVYTKSDAAAAPDGANFILRARLVAFDTENVAEPTGQLFRKMTGARASIAKI